MEINKTKMALIVIAALGSIAQANSEQISTSSQFTPIENLSAQDRVAVQIRLESEYPSEQFDWENSIVGLNENNQIEVRDKKSLNLQMIARPTCL